MIKNQFTEALKFALKGTPPKTQLLLLRFKLLIKATQRLHTAAILQLSIIPKMRILVVTTILKNWKQQNR